MNNTALSATHMVNISFVDNAASGTGLLKMRKEFYIGTNEDITDYMERAASYIRSIKQGRKLADGIR